ncbi:ankyrin [Arthroderma uncinatum]|uniref:ankyrin n=1 Tax=Arthroderma uncinatum TaxID=74035 RepID=UPI00144ACF99|nr:ankyrin [Arthroderma uncinatum]KAF3491740.1 ankyrin [Arthroderma uncinatum]
MTRLPQAGVTALIERLIALGADTEARAVVPDERYRYKLVGYHAKLLLQQKPPIAREQTPLHWAASNGSVAVVKALLQHGANPVARDSTGSTPALCAAYAQPTNRQPYPIAKRQQVIKLLLTHGAGYEDEDASGRGVYGWAAVNGLPLYWPEW